jgi:hypothetical protein
VSAKLVGLVAVLVALGGVYEVMKPRPARLSDRLIVAKVPWQVTDLEGGESWKKNGFRLQKLADFRVHARVVGKKRYRTSYSAKIGPWDFAMVWGRASDQRVLDKCSFSQGDRWGNWILEDGSPITREEMISLFSNFHLVPATDAIMAQLDRVELGSAIEIKGKLVLITDKSGFAWRSSLSRTDVGNGACEIVWVEKVRTLRTSELVLAPP